MSDSPGGEGEGSTLRAPLSGIFHQTLPDLVTPLKAHALSLPAAVHRRGKRPPKGLGTDQTPSTGLWRKVPESDARSVGTDQTPSIGLRHPSFNHCRIYLRHRYQKLSANKQFFVYARTVVSLLQTTQIKQDVSFIPANKVYTSANKTTIV